MKENRYDDDIFFEKYSQMERSKKGLEGAGEWYELKKLIPDLEGKRVLDLGCGYGWHCSYAAEKGAAHVLSLIHISLFATIIQGKLLCTM